MTEAHGPGSVSPEIEAKFLIDDTFRVDQLLALLRSENVTVEEAPAQEIHDRYLDTGDWRLFRAGWGYRWQEVDGQRKMGLKVLTRSGSAVQEREEVEQIVAALPSAPGEAPEGPVAQRVRQIAGPETPREIFSVHKKRQRYLLRPDRQTTIELALDLADIRSAEAPKSGAPGKLVFRELEMELVSGAREHVDRLSAVLERDFGLLPARLSKYERGLQASGLQPPLPSLLACGPATTPETPTVWFAFRCLDDLLHALRLHEGGTWEGLHPEALHQMRVATRRIRSAFSVFRAAFPERAHRSFSRELRWLAGTLGPARDIEVHQGDLEPYVRTLAAGDQAQIQPYREALEGERQKARKAVRAALDSGRCRRLIERLGSLVRRGPAKRRLRGPQPVGEFARRAMSRTLRKVLRAGRKVAKGPSQEQMHRLRIRCKRLRYTLEFFMPLFGDKALKPFAKALRRLQNVLGEHRDACVASERLRGYAEKVPARGGRQGLLLALGQLISAYERAAEQYRSDFPGVWRELDRGKTRQRLKMALNKTVSSKQGV